MSDEAENILRRIVNVKASMVTEFSKRPEIRIICDNEEEAWKLMYALGDARKLIGTS